MAAAVDSISTALKGILQMGRKRSSSNEPFGLNGTTTTNYTGTSHNDESVVHVNIDDAIESLGMGKFQYRILVAAGLCFMADSMEILLLSFLAIVLRDQWNLSEHETALITTSSFIGALIGTLMLGHLGDKWGRKPVFTATAAIICFFGLATAATHNIYTLLLARFLVGFGVGGLTVPFDTLAEFVPTSLRGTNLMAVEYFWTMGTLLVPVLAYMTLGVNATEWRLFVVYCSIPCFLSVVVGVLYVPESPRWLLTQNRQEQALRILRKAARINNLNPDELFPVNAQLYDACPEQHASICDLFSPTWFKTTMSMWATWLGLAVSYYGTIYVVTFIFADNNNDNGDYEFDYGAILASASAEVAAITLIIFTIDRVGRIPLQAISYTIGGFAVFTLCFIKAKYGDNLRGSLIILAFMARMAFMSGTCTTWVSTAEILTTDIRTTGHAASNAVARIGGALFPFMITPKTSYTLIGSVLLGISIFTTFSVCQLPETAGKNMGSMSTNDDDGDMETTAIQKGELS